MRRTRLFAVAIGAIVLGFLLVSRSLLVRAAPAAAPLPVSAPSVAELRAELERVQRAQPGLKPGALTSIAYTIDVAERISDHFKPQSDAWRARAARYLALANQGRDPMLEQRGKLIMRGYRSAASEHLQGYGLYVPASYDPARAYPLLIMLHGGSANGNLFLGVVLGNNMNWKEYDIHLWDEFEARWTPDWIVVAPDGFGQVMWRWMGEQDVLDVIDDVQKHYNVNADRVVLGGLSNGGVGAYNLGMRHAYRFSAVTAIAGAPSWLQYSGGNIPEAQRSAMAAQSGMQLIENAINTDFRYFHGRTDTGPMRPRFIEELGKLIRTLGVPFKETWFDAGHDLLYLVHRHGKIYEDLDKTERKQKPTEVRVVTGDYRAARQHWVAITRIDDYPKLARVRALVSGGTRVTLETKNTLALELDLTQAPLAAGDALELAIDDKPVYSGPRSALGGVAKLYKDGGGWHVGAWPSPKDHLEKKLGSSGPIPDAYYGPMAHVYGTLDPAALPALKKSAERGSKGWPLWLWRVQQPVVADTDVSDALMHSHNLVLYATPGSNRVLERLAPQLPVRIDQNGVVLGNRRIDAKGVGVKLIYPNPVAPERYIIIMAAPTTAAVNAGHNLPDFLPDFVVYDARTTQSRPRLVFDAGHPPQLMGYFDRNWQLPASVVNEGGDEQPENPPEAVASASLRTRVTAPPESPMPAGMRKKAPPPPVPPTQFAAPEATQAGMAARQIARLVPTFTNYRATIRDASWVVDEAARWSIRDNDSCLADLRAQGIPFYAVDPGSKPLVPTPVEVTGPIEGVEFHMTHPERTLLMSCELAARLPVLARALHEHGVLKADVISSYRDKPYPSFHRLGLGFDLGRFFTADAVLDVLHDFVETPGIETCKAPPPSNPRARALLEIACAIGATKRFSSVLTPNYNAGHRNHFHLDVRPDDPRFFLR